MLLSIAVSDASIFSVVLLVLRFSTVLANLKVLKFYGTDEFVELSYK